MYERSWNRSAFPGGCRLEILNPVVVASLGWLQTRGIKAHKPARCSLGGTFQASFDDTVTLSWTDIGTHCPHAYISINLQNKAGCTFTWWFSSCFLMATSRSHNWLGAVIPFTNKEPNSMPNHLFDRATKPFHSFIFYSGSLLSRRAALSSSITNVPAVNREHRCGAPPWLATKERKHSHAASL